MAAPVTRLSANTETGRTSLTSRSRASVINSASKPAATGSNAATTPRKIQSVRSRSSGNAISSARTRSRSDCLPICSLASAAPPTVPGSVCASCVTFGATASPRVRNHAATSTSVPSRDTAAREATRATVGTRRNRAAATAASFGRATTSSDGPGRTCVARDSRSSVRKLSEEPFWKSLSLDSSRDGVETPNEAAARVATNATATIARGRRYARSASAVSIGTSRMPVVLQELLPDSARVEDGELVLGGVRASELVREFGTPGVVYDEETLRRNARDYRAAAPGALIAYGTKAFPSVAVLRLFAEEGLGADVSTVGELAFALRAGVEGAQLVIHGNNKEDELLRRSVEEGAVIGLDSLDELERARALGATRCLIRVTPGIEADTLEAVKTAHHGSKFGLPPDDAVDAIGRFPECLGLHAHVGSQLLHFGASLMTVGWL